MQDMKEWLQRRREGLTRLQLLQRIIDTGEPCNVPLDTETPETHMEVLPQEAKLLVAVYHHLSPAKQESWARDNLDDCMLNCIGFVHAQAARSDPSGLLDNLTQLFEE